MVLSPQRDRARKLKSEPGWLTQLKLGLALIGIILWAYGARVEVEWLRWSGIAFLASSVVVRLFFRRRADPLADDAPDDSEKR